MNRQLRARLLLEEARALGLDSHRATVWLREKNASEREQPVAGNPVAQAFAGDAPPTVTGRYLHATLADVATAVAALTGEAHPLADCRALPRCGRG